MFFFFNLLRNGVFFRFCYVVKIKVAVICAAMTGSFKYFPGVFSRIIKVKKANVFAAIFVSANAKLLMEFEPA